MPSFYPISSATISDIPSSRSMTGGSGSYILSPGTAEWEIVLAPRAGGGVGGWTSHYDRADIFQKQPKLTPVRPPKHYSLLCLKGEYQLREDVVLTVLSVKIRGSRASYRVGLDTTVFNFRRPYNPERELLDNLTRLLEEDPTCVSMSVMAYQNQEALELIGREYATTTV